MNSKITSNKKKNISVKSIVFWSIMAAVVLGLITMFIIRAVQKKDITSYTKLESVQGQELFAQKESEYYVLIYDFAGESAMEDFDKTVFQYLTYCRDNSLKGTKVYKFDTDDLINKMCLGDECNLVGTSSFPTPNQKFSQDQSAIISVAADECPVLVVVSGGQITTAYEGTSEILTQLNSQMSK